LIRRERDEWRFRTDINPAARRYKLTHEAADMLLRCDLAEALRKWMTRERLTQAQAAKRLGVVQPYVSEITCNKVDKLSLDYLVGFCAKAGLTVLSGWSLSRIPQPLSLQC
jgi:predicted XRE-type DNA-binding protein